MKSFLRRRELVHERRKPNLAEPLATRTLLPCTARNVVHLTLKRSFSTQSAFVKDDTNGPQPPLGYRQFNVRFTT
jgi:hypothetical protein